MADFKIGEDYIVDKLGYAQSYPVGSVIITMSSTIPDGWLLCDGRPVLRSDYSELFSLLGTTYGTGDGSTTFNLPPLVVNATHNPSGRLAVSRQSSEPAYPANFAHDHFYYKGVSTAYTTDDYGPITHNHTNMNIDSAAANMTHNHATMGGGSGLNNATSNSASSRASSANNAVEYSNDYVHDHGGAFTATLTMNTSASVSHSHLIQVHSADNISHTHTPIQNTNVTISSVSYQGITSGSATHVPLSKEAYFIIKY